MEPVRYAASVRRPDEEGLREGFPSGFPHPIDVPAARYPEHPELVQLIGDAWAAMGPLTELDDTELSNRERARNANRRIARTHRPPLLGLVWHRTVARARGGDHGYASGGVPVVLPCPQCEIA